MNVSKVAQFVTKAAAKINSMPTWTKVVGVGAVFAGGMLTEKSIIGDKFEKTDARLTAIENYLNVEVLKKAMAESAAQAKEAKRGNAKVKKENQVELIKPKDYVSPKLSENGRIDTAYYDATRLPRFISYKDKLTGVNENELCTVREEAYEKDGKMLLYRVYDWSDVPTSGYYEGEPSKTTYSFGGDILDKDERGSWGRVLTFHRSSGVSSGVSNESRWEYDHNGCLKRLKETDHGKEFYVSFTEYNSDGSKTKELRGDNKKEIQKIGKDDKVLERKRFGENDILQYTITPQYDKDGNLIKNDTVWNK